MNGDKRFDGLAVSEWKDKSYSFEVDGSPVVVRQRFFSPNPHCDILEFAFDVKNSSRFRLDVLLPERAANACVTLNGSVLISYFSDVFPQGCEYPVPSVCPDAAESGHEKISTLVPGKFQSINFKWYSTDILMFYLYYN